MLGPILDLQEETKTDRNAKDIDKQNVYISFKSLKDVKVESGIYKTYNVLKDGHKARRGKFNI